MSTKFQELPSHLKQFLVEQDYSVYTAIDQASWRYIMRVSQAFFKDHAHPIYLDGLKRAGISTERIPLISEMDEKLKQFGWRAVSITGFIPPEVFLEMLSLQILPIACDMRKLEHIEYTPAPDIVHEAAGHAPILADPGYSSFLRKFGEIARWVIFAEEDTEVYQALLELSEVKEDPKSTSAEVAQAQGALNKAYSKVKYVSEAQALTRLGWWTTEYGLFKKGSDFLIYGAGLLSSAGESYNCLSEKVKKIPLDIHCTEMDYDITRPQLQLFYTDDFKKLEATIDELASRMSYKIGGPESLERARVARTVTTAVVETGLQISGVLKNFVVNSKNEVCMLTYGGPSQLAVSEGQVAKHGPSIHKNGITVALGSLIGEKQENLKIGQKIDFHLDTGSAITGSLSELSKENNKILFAIVEDYQIKQNAEIFSSDSDGALVVPFANKVTSVFGGAADRASYLAETKSKFTKPRQPKVNLTDENKNLIPLYAEVRKMRESKSISEPAIGKLVEKLEAHYPHDWLLRLEILELVGKNEKFKDVSEKTNESLQKIISEGAPRRNLIERGLGLLV